MDIELTAATERAIQEAAAWCLDGSGGSIEPPAILLGLLAEPECRAAITLASVAIDSTAVREQWSKLRRRSDGGPAATAPAKVECDPTERIPRFSPELQASVTAAKDWLADLPHPFTLATEHLLLGLVAAELEVGRWLREQGLNAEVLRDQILEQYGLTAAPVDLEPVADPNEDLSDDALPEGFSEKPATPPTAVAPGTATAGSGPSFGDPPGLIRLVDASANRAREALRVIEDYVRFVLDDRHLMERLKVLRHDLTAALSTVKISDRLAMRDTQGDVGTTVSTDAELSRQDVTDVLTANFTRLQECLRSLEEFGKIGSPVAAQSLERLRYDSYILHKAVHGTAESLARLARARLYVLIDGGSDVDAFEKLVSSLVEAGIHLLQLRDKRLDDRSLRDRARRLRDLTASSETLFIMNDRPDVAVLAEADGVHVGQEELTVRDVRRIVGTQMLVGVSTHGIEQARQAVLDGASYLGVGPTFPSSTKAFREFPGLELARQVAAEIRLPAFAIGGIDGSNVAQVLASGIGRVAVSGAVAASENPAAAARRLLELLQASES